MKENVGFELPGMNVKGEYTIQLFDENGDLVHEETKHNCINKALFSTAYWNNILCGIIDNDSRKNDSYGSYNTKGIYTGHVNWLMLTKDNTTLPDDYKNPVILGEMIGYAHSGDTNSYTDNKRGIPNINETVKVMNYLDGGNKIKSVTKHYVWDFATDKGNGEFDNIYLTGLPLNYSDASYNPNDYRGDFSKFKDFDLNKNSTDNIYSSDAGPFSHDTENLYVQCLFLANIAKSGTTQNMCYDTIAKISQDTWNVEYITLQVPNANSDNAAYIVQSGGYFWRIEYNFACTKYRLNGEYVGTVNLSSQFSNSFLNIGTSTNNITHSSYGRYTYKYYLDVFTGDDKYLYVGYKTSDYKRYICIFDANGTKVSEKYIGDSGGKNNDYQQCCLNILYINNKKVLLSSSYNDTTNVFDVKDDGSLTEISNDNLKFLSENIKKAEGYSNSTNCVFYNKNGDLFMLPYENEYNYGFRIAVGHFIPWTSHVKLDTPITKTSANTMKIQYDITCEYVPVGGIENIE